MSKSQRAVQEWLEAKAGFTALFCFNDHLAFGAARALLNRGMRIPGDVSVVGYDGTWFAELFNPALTTVAQPLGHSWLLPAVRYGLQRPERRTDSRNRSVH